MSSTAEKTMKIAALLAGGAVVGAGIGLLYAPQSGSETRRQVRHYAKRTRYEAIRVGRQVRAGVDRTIESGKAWLNRNGQQATVKAA